MSERTQVFRKKPEPGFEIAIPLTIALGTFLAVAFLLLAHWMPASDAFTERFKELIWDRGPLQIMIVVVFWWSVSFFLLKWYGLSRISTRGFRKLVSATIPRRIDPDNAYEVVNGIGYTGNLIFDYRLRRCMQILIDRRDPRAATEFVERQGRADEEAAFRSYAFARYTIWAMPILGFIGTVLGIGIAVASFSGSLGQQVEQLEQVLGSLTGVVGGLTTAFDTTLLGLCTTVVIMLVYTLTLRQEQRIFTTVEAILRREILNRLHSGIDPRDMVGSGSGPGADPEQIQAAIQQAIAGSGQALAAIGRQMGEAMAKQLAQTIATSTAQALEQASAKHTQLADAHLQKMDAVFAEGRKLVQQQTDAVQEMQRVERVQVEDMRKVHEALAGVWPLLAGLSQGFRIAPLDPQAGPAAAAPAATQEVPSGSGDPAHAETEKIDPGVFADTIREGMPSQPVTGTASGAGDTTAKPTGDSAELEPLSSSPFPFDDQDPFAGEEDFGAFPDEQGGDPGAADARQGDNDDDDADESGPPDVSGSEHRDLP